MRVAVISDIHSNLHALDSVLAAVAAESVDEIWCLGDLVGYGPRPNECIERTRGGAAFSLCGNHDLAVIGSIDPDDFSGDAGRAVRWTQGELAPEHRDWLLTLRPAGEREGAELYHASPRDPVWEYVLSDHVALLSLAETAAPLVLVGHSHVALGVSFDGEALGGGLAPEGTEADLGAGRWLLNPGSVGQPRDGDSRAAWLLVDLDAGRATFHRTEYPVAETQADIVARGLPPALAARLGHGM